MTVFIADLRLTISEFASFASECLKENPVVINNGVFFFVLPTLYFVLSNGGDVGALRSS